MEICFSDRQSGKTQALLDWLVAGHPIAHYPGWSRVIICATHRRAVDVAKRLAYMARLSTDSAEPKGYSDMLESVWSWEKAIYNIRGAARDFEYAIDDLEEVLPSLARGAVFATMSLPTISLEEVRNHAD